MRLDAVKSMRMQICVTRPRDTDGFSTLIRHRDVSDRVTPVSSVWMGREASRWKPSRRIRTASEVEPSKTGLPWSKGRRLAYTRTRPARR